MLDIAQLRARAPEAELHRESLLHVPLIRHVFCDRSFRLIPRGIDVRWSYERHTPIVMTGFNPFEFAFYYGADSRVAAWFTDPFGSARDFNENDLLVREALFMTHDYLHAWTYSLVDRLFPALGVLHGAITADTFDDYVFCHLVSEAAATVGLDYWLLCEREVNEFCPIGSTMAALTVSYREAQLTEYRRGCPDLEVQSPEFFRTLAAFYCTGEFLGFDTDDIRRSPLLLRWLRHELSYGATQRKLTRNWLAYLAGAPLSLSESEASAPLAIDSELRHQIIDEVGKHLWALVKREGRAITLELPASPPARHAPLDRPCDFRFVNLSRVSDAETERALQRPAEENFKFFLYQFLSQIPLSAFPERMHKHVPVLMTQRDLALTRDLLRDLPRRDPLPDEPRDLMLAN